MKKEECGFCMGLGRVEYDGSMMVPCPDCDGKGYSEIPEEGESE